MGGALRLEHHGKCCVLGVRLAYAGEGHAGPEAQLMSAPVKPEHVLPMICIYLPSRSSSDSASPYSATLASPIQQPLPFEMQYIEERLGLCPMACLRQ